MNRPLKNRPLQAGFSMIEVMVSLVILLLGLLGLVGLIGVSQRAETESYQRSQALLLLQDMAGRINANRRVATCYAITTDTLNGVPYLGKDSTLSPACGFGTTQANNLAASDLAAWNSLLAGAAETIGGSNAVSFVMDLASRQEQYNLDARLYTNQLSLLGAATIPAEVSTKYNVTVAVDNTLAPPVYSVTATPSGTQLVQDTQCGTLNIDQTGLKTISGTGTVSKCW